MQLVDVLRGYALFGVFLVRMTEVYSGWNEANATALSIAPVDALAEYLVRTLAQDKFRALFSLLFGLGFYMQLQKSEAKGSAFGAVFCRRLAVLFLFGLCHAYLLWSGDILRWYAIAGLFLLPLRRLTPQWLFFLGLFLVVAPNVAYETAGKWLVMNPPADEGERAAVRTLTSTSSYWTMLQANVRIVNASWLHIGEHISNIAVVVGYFLLGVWCGRLQLFSPGAVRRQCNTHRTHIRKILLALLFAGIFILAVTAAWVLAAGISPGTLFSSGSLPRLILAHAKTPVIVAVHIGLVMALYHFPFWRKRIMILSYAGRMTLTNYIAQSVIGIGIFYGVGLGLHGQIRPVFTVLLTIALFILQVLFSWWWLGRYRVGPLERVWRLLVRGNQ